MAQISFQGRIIGQPELKFSQAGKPLLRFRTVENSHRQIDGEWKDVGAAWRDVTVFGKQAEHLAEHLADKQIVAISGRLDAREWEKQDGTKQTSFEVLADVVGIVPARQQAPTQPPTPSPHLTRGAHKTAASQRKHPSDESHTSHLRGVRPRYPILTHATHTAKAGVPAPTKVQRTEKCLTSKAH